MTAVSKEAYKLPDVFVISSGRSGTTLLSSILNASDEIYFPYESDFIARAYPFYGNQKVISESDYLQIVNLFKLSSQPENWGMSSEYIHSYLTKYSPKSFSEVLSVICSAYHRQEGTHHLLWGIKAPVLIASLHIIQFVCPNTKIIHLVRDGRDVYLSYKKIHDKSSVKFGPKGVIQSALYWIDGLRRVEEFAKRKALNPLFELRYVDLMESPERELQALCTYLKIGYKASMYKEFNNHEKNKKLTPEKLKRDVHKNVQNGLVSTNTKKYLSMMTLWEKFQYELIAAPYLVKYGYSLEFQFLSFFGFSPIRRVLYLLARLLNDLRYLWRDQRTYKDSL